MTALIKQPTAQDLQMYAEFADSSWESFGEQEFVKPPVLAIAQPTSDHKPEGEFFLTATDESLGETVRLVLLHIQRTMAYRPDGYDSPAVCWSRDFAKPAANVPEKQCAQCHKLTSRRPVAVCPLAQWTGETGNRKAPLCTETWILGVGLLDEEYTFDPQRTALLYLRSSNLSPMRDYMGQFRTLYKRIPLFGASIDMQLTHRTKKDGAAGNHYVLNFPDLRNDEGRFAILPADSVQMRYESSQFFKAYLSSDEVVEGDTSQTDDTPVTQSSGTTPPATTISTPGKQENLAINGQGWGA